MSRPDAPAPSGPQTAPYPVHTTEGPRRILPWILSGLLLLVGGNAPADPKRYPLGDIPLAPEVYKRFLKPRGADMAVTLPSSYDARTEGIVTPAKDQGNCGSCWAFATVGAMESHLLKELGVGPENLSEQQQVYCNTANYGCAGGYATAVRYWEAPPWPDKGPLDEAVFPYTANQATPCYEPISEQMPYRITNYHTVPTTTADFKQSLYVDGPSYWRYTVYSDFYTFWGASNPGAVYVNTGGTYEGGHAALLIGWDDNKGALLLKNSWGGGGPNGDGTFWIAYQGHANNLGFGMMNFDVVALSTCTSDADCDDGVHCNGAETCGAAGACQAGTPVSCGDNGLYCDGVEVCDEESNSCMSANAPCQGEICVEDGDYCQPQTCGNDICDQGESCHNCPSDCISGTGSGTEAACFKGVADGVCHPVKETTACIDCSPGYCCGDGVCTADAENSLNCALDCGNEPPSEICNNGIDDDGDNLADCDDPDCAGSGYCPPTCGPKKAACGANEDCCSGRCNLSKAVCL